MPSITLDRRLLGLAAGLFAVVVIAGFVLLLTAEDDPEFGTPEPPSTFYFEARIKIAGSDPDRPPVDIVRSWYEAPDHWRWEYAYSDQPDRVDSMQVSDGQSLWTYSGRTNTYQVQPVTDAQRESGGLISASFILGPLQAESLGAYFNSPQFVSHEVVRREHLLGRNVAVIEADSGTAQTTFWVDVQRLFVLRYVHRPGPTGVGGLDARITEVRYGEDFPDSVFRFEPPPGSRSATAPAP